MVAGGAREGRRLGHSVLRSPDWWRSLPVALDAVLVELRVVADEWQPLDERLGDQEAIEGISVLGERQCGDGAGVLGGRRATPSTGVTLEAGDS